MGWWSRKSNTSEPQTGNGARVPQIAAELIAALGTVRGRPGAGIDIPLTDKEDPESVVLMSLAVEHIRKNRRDIEVQVFPNNLHLTWKSNATTISDGLRDQLRSKGFIADQDNIDEVALPTAPMETSGAADPADLSPEERIERGQAFARRNEKGVDIPGDEELVAMSPEARNSAEARVRLELIAAERREKSKGVIKGGV